MILDSDTNIVYFSKRLLEYTHGIDIVKQLDEHGVFVDFIPSTRDVWARDYMPVQLADNKYIGYEYCPNYLYPNYTSLITNQARVCDEMDIETVPTGLIIDGGNVVKTSKGIIMIDKVFCENNHFSKIELINRLENAFCSEIIFLPWDRSEYYGHADGVVREISAGKVLMTNYHQFSKKYAEQFEKILSSHFDVEVLDYEVEKPHKNNWCYINFLRVGNKIFLPQLTPMRRLVEEESNIVNNKTEYAPTGKIVEEDALAVEQFKRLFTDCEIIPVSCPKIVDKGGALNCISWNVKEARASVLPET
ncbi:MAG: agmatine deiminase family protein [Muribaculaceae bacterium]